MKKKGGGAPKVNSEMFAPRGTVASQGRCPDRNMMSCVQLRPAQEDGGEESQRGVWKGVRGKRRRKGGGGGGGGACGINRDGVLVSDFSKLRGPKRLLKAMWQKRTDRGGCH